MSTLAEVVIRGRPKLLPYRLTFDSMSTQSTMDSELRPRGISYDAAYKLTIPSVERAVQNTCKGIRIHYIHSHSGGEADITTRKPTRRTLSFETPLNYVSVREALATVPL